MECTFRDACSFNNNIIQPRDIIQITDFGMSRDIEDGTYYMSHGGKIPVKWTAPEVTES